MYRYRQLVDSTDTAYLGTVESTKLLTGREIIEQLGITTGILYNSNTDWLHFYVGKDAICNRDPNKRPYYIWIAKKPVMHSISWDDINTAGAVSGKLVADKNGKEYLCRIPTGASDNRSEWNALIYRMFRIDTSGIRLGDWNMFNLAPPELEFGGDIGHRTWCRDIIKDKERALYRSIQTESYSYSPRFLDTTNYGFRPVLIKYIE